MPVLKPAFTDITTFCHVESNRITTSMSPASSETIDAKMHSGVVEFVGWESWTALHHIEAIHGWINNAIHQYGPIRCWGETFSRECSEMRGEDIADRSLDMMKEHVRMVQSVLSYLGRAMEGEVSPSVGEWPALYAQSHQLASQLWGAVLGVQHMLDRTVSGQALLSQSLSV